MDKNTEEAFETLEKALRPEVTREQMYAVIEHLTEAIESMIELPEEDEMEEEDVESESESEDSNPMPVGDPDKNSVNWPIIKSEDYESDNEEEDKWDNIQKACWTGYTQRGMKEKNGRMVPNCVPVEKAHEATETKEEPKIKKSIWGGSLNPNIKK